MKISHLYYSNNGNWGDITLGEVTRKLFDYFLGENVYDIVPVSNNFEEILRKANNSDLLLIGGGGMILYFGHLVNSGILDKINVPIVVYGVGFNAFYIQKHIQYNRKLLQQLKDKAIFFSVRCDGSSKKIKDDIEINLKESAPPATWASKFFKYNSFKEQYILLSIANDKPDVRLINHTDFKNSLANLCNKIYDNSNYKIICINHRIQDNIDLPHIYKNINAYEYTKDAIDNLFWYSNAKAVLAMRGHAQIFSFSYDIPFVSVSTQDKIKEYSKLLKMNDYKVNCFNPDLVVDDLLNVSYSSYKKIKESMWNNTCEDFKIIKEKLKI